MMNFRFRLSGVRYAAHSDLAAIASGSDPTSGTSGTLFIDLPY